MKRGGQSLKDLYKLFTGSSSKNIHIQPDGKRASVFLPPISKWNDILDDHRKSWNFCRLLRTIENELKQSKNFRLLQLTSDSHKIKPRMNADKMTFSQQFFNYDGPLKLVYKPGHISLYNWSILIDLQDEDSKSIARCQKQFENVDEHTKKIFEINSRDLHSYYPGSTEVSSIPTEIVTEPKDSHTIKIYATEKNPHITYGQDKMLIDCINCALSAREAGNFTQFEAAIDLNNVKSISSNYFAPFGFNTEVNVSVWPGAYENNKLHFLTANNQQIINFCTIEFNSEKVATNDEMYKAYDKILSTESHYDMSVDLSKYRDMQLVYPPTV